MSCSLCVCARVTCMPLRLTVCNRHMRVRSHLLKSANRLACRWRESPLRTWLAGSCMLGMVVRLASKCNPEYFTHPMERNYMPPHVAKKAAAAAEVSCAYVCLYLCESMKDWRNSCSEACPGQTPVFNTTPGLMERVVITTTPPILCLDVVNNAGIRLAEQMRLFHCCSQTT